MNEIEVKILDVNKEEVEKKLRFFGAEKIFDDDIEAIYFDKTDQSIRKAKDVCRLRKEGEKVVFTYKKFVSDGLVKIRDETEIEVSDFENAKKYLEKRGLTPWITMKKHRISYKLDDVRFEFDKHHDQYSFVPEFLEIEARDSEELYQWADLLGFRKGDCKPWIIQEVAEYYRNSFIDAIKECVSGGFRSYQIPIASILKAIENEDAASAKTNLLNMMANLYAQNYPIMEMPLKAGNARHFYENMKKLRGTL